MGLAEELWGLPCQAAVQLVSLRAESIKQTGLGKAVAVGMHVSWIWE